MLTGVDEDAVEPDKAPVTVVGVPDSGVSCTWMIVPGGRLVALTIITTGLETEVGTTISGGALIDPTGFAGAGTPPTESTLSVGELARVTGLGWPRVIAEVEHSTERPLRLKASTRPMPEPPSLLLAPC
jgi:hypothetical protein